ncbi:hypothetical protein GLOTRDRAFT_133197 [Gloeophyllum trabeum ATCC 11539]|uniref:Uncharacterized protein n=1 Tax=Gloeophyllum trabeum (strain ATCC 11539 / FP-39264 / Madison 617) TaxID=670483 RepID=S7PV15_GLOTA|nr:uncharacterized protein GLOTRDRAFT_133197 [Gloeophyllum trabeum ATCC 11539]EPQ51323.1 hypothetical protein GLOTRDRAFT_133197 [Gloeophyllum trabeum ATCC 11539]
MDKLAAAVQEDMFKLSPLPSTLHVPTELPPDSETPEPEFQKKGSGLSEAYTRQSIPAISINPSDASLSGSLLSRRMREHDENMAQSLPQRDEYGSIHRFMASRQPSPPRASSSMAYVPYDPSGDVIMASASVPRGSVLRESKQPPVHTCAEEEQHERWRKELHDLLQLPTNSSGAIREDSDFVPSLSRVGSLSRVRPSSPPRYSGDSSHPAMSRLRAEPLHQGRERSHSEAVYPQSSSSFRFYVSHPPSPPPSTSPTGMASPLSATSMSPTSPGTAQIPRPSLISRASSAAREAETRARERNRKESGGSTTSLSSIASSSSGRTPSALREPTEALSRRSSLANRGPSRSGHTPGIQIIS